ncbi:MAG: short chain dehydrogenase [Sphingomonas bacterium]|nr:short chain dehydrogenase [Sphingomonas bacterium]
MPSAYAASKFAVTGIAEAPRCELVHAGISVTLICPGSIETGKRNAGRAAVPVRRADGACDRAGFALSTVVAS